PQKKRQNKSTEEAAKRIPETLFARPTLEKSFGQILKAVGLRRRIGRKLLFYHTNLRRKSSKISGAIRLHLSRWQRR
ncbi:Hypothetical predicted protein, partial [Olea europaea subsp. europaea]